MLTVPREALLRRRPRWHGILAMPRRVHRPNGSAAQPDSATPRVNRANAAPAAFTAQTGEQDSWSATRNELPQPQAATTLGFSTLNPAPVSAST